MPRKMGNETIFSSQEATQLIFMDSDSEGDEVDLVKINVKILTKNLIGNLIMKI